MVRRRVSEIKLPPQVPRRTTPACPGEGGITRCRQSRCDPCRRSNKMGFRFAPRSLITQSVDVRHRTWGWFCVSDDELIRTPASAVIRKMSRWHKPRESRSAPPRGRLGTTNGNQGSILTPWHSGRSGVLACRTLGWLDGSSIQDRGFRAFGTGRRSRPPYP
jgi:hypothetical protein